MTRFSILMLAPCPFPTRQGTQVFIRHLASALASLHEVHLVTYGHGEYHHADLPFHVHRAPRVATGLRSGPQPLKLLADAAMVRTAMGVLSRYPCALIHAHNVEGLAIALCIKNRTGHPIVYHAHNTMETELPTYFRTRLAQRATALLGHVIDHTMVRHADDVIVFDRDQRALHEGFGVASARIHVIPPGLLSNEICLDNSADTPWIRRKLGMGPWILYAGNPDGYQNLDLLWRALPLVRRERPDVRLLVACNHPETAFAATLAAAGNPQGVTVQRYETLAELRALFALAQVGVSPRRLRPGAPIKVLNYLAAGVPVVACRRATRYIVGDGAGALVQDTPEAFAAGILHVLKGRFARSTVQQGFASFRLERQRHLYLSVYRRCIARTRDTLKAPTTLSPRQ